MPIIKRSYSEPDQDGISMKERWNGPDRGLISCWEVGRRTRLKNKSPAERAQRGELPVLSWKGGVKEDLKLKTKYGTLHYLAQWLGLTGRDLDIDLDEEVTLVCTNTGIEVTFTFDSEKYLNIA